MKSLQSALEIFNADLGRYPTSTEGLAILVRSPLGASSNRWHGPYLKWSVQDAWRRDFIYRFPGVHNPGAFDLYSCGEDGVSKSGGEDPDDINNWDPSQPWRAHYVRASLKWKLVPLSCVALFAITMAALSRWLKRSAAAWEPDASYPGTGS